MQILLVMKLLEIFANDRGKSHCQMANIKLIDTEKLLSFYSFLELIQA